MLTGGTAVLASWVTSRGNARAAKIQVQSSAQADHRSRIRQSRRAAYLDLIEQAHITGELYFRLGDIYAQVTDPGEQLARIYKLRSDLRDAFNPLMRSVRVVLLEGPPQAAKAAEAVQQAAAEAVQQAAADTNTSLWMISQGHTQARQRFDAADQIFRAELSKFIESARTAMTGFD